jgi:peptide deformylase
LLAAVTVNYIALDLEEMSKKLDEALANMTQEEIDKYFP